MRSDLTKACVPCAWRIASENEACPRCGGVLVTPRAALDALIDPKVRPVRDTLLFGSGAILSVISLVGGFALAFSSIFLEKFQGSSGFAAILFVVSIFAFTAALTILLGAAWAILAVPVLLVSWLANRGLVSALRVAPFAREAGVGHEPPRGKWLDTFNAWLSLKKKRMIVVAVLAIAGVEVVAELFAAEPYFWNHSPIDSAKVIGLAAISQVVGLAFLMVPFVGSMQWALWSLDHLRRLRHIARQRGVEKLANDPDAHVDARPSEQGHVEGRTVRTDASPLTAPLSGEECLGFRLTGRVGTALLDDAFVTSELEVEAGDTRAAVRAERVVLLLPEAMERAEKLTPEQKSRLELWLAKLGLPASDDVELGESLLREGDRVSAEGAESREAVQAEGYRNAARRTVLDGSDGAPVLIRRMEVRPLPRAP